jgi:hypothetical protein
MRASHRTAIAVSLATALLTLPLAACSNSGGGGNANDDGPPSGSPSLGLSLQTFAFSSIEGFGGTMNQLVVLSNEGSGKLDWQASSSDPWLTVQPSTGSLTTKNQSLTLTVDPSKLAAAGSYTAELTISASGAGNSPKTIQVSLVLIPSDCEELPVNTRSDRVLTAGCYNVAGDAAVFGGAMLTIDPGVFLVFAPGASLTIQNDGRLSAVGTAGAPIFFTAAQAERGTWDGVRFSGSNSPDNRLEHVTIEYAGFDMAGALTLDGTASSPTRLTLRNCTLRGSASHGLWLDRDAVFDELSGCVFTGNAQGAASVPANQVAVLDPGSIYSGNDDDVVQIRSDTLTSDQTWAVLGADYLIHEDVIVAAGLTLDPGVTVVFEQERKLTVEDGGWLSAVGSAAAPIVFTGEEAIRGHWAGLVFNSSSAAENRLENAIVEYGGGMAQPATLVLIGTPARPARLSIVNSTLRESASLGLYLDEDVVVDQFAANILTYNAAGPASLMAGDAGIFDEESSFSGNDVERVELRGGSVTTDQTWPGIDTEYTVTASIAVHAALTLAAGAVLVFDEDMEMSVTDGGSLRAVGSAEEPIILTGAESTPGYWGGLRINGSNSDFNRLEHVTIEFGGGWWEANLYLNGTPESPTTIDVLNSSFRGSPRWGIVLDSDVVVNDDFEEVNTFADNRLGEVRKP